MKTESTANRVAVIKLGGSATIGPKGVNSREVRGLLQQLQPALDSFQHKVFVIGGGNRVREE